MTRKRRRIIKAEPVFSGIDRLPTGRAPERVIPGCIVLEGGAFRGVYGEGVLDVLMREGLNLQTTIGVSAGALNGMNYVSGQIGRSARINLRYRHNSQYVGPKAFLHNQGMIGFDFAFQKMPYIEDFDQERFETDNRRFVAVATNCHTGEPMYFERSTCSDMFQAVRASASMPYMSGMVDVDGTFCLDGGCSMAIPYQWAIDQGFEKIVVVRTRPAEYRCPTKKRHPMADAMYREYTAFATALVESDDRYNRQCEELIQLEQEGRILVINPSRTVPVSRLEGDMEILGGLYYLGYKDALQNLERIQAYLQS